MWVLEVSLLEVGVGLVLPSCSWWAAVSVLRAWLLVEGVVMLAVGTPGRMSLGVAMRLHLKLSQIVMPSFTLVCPVPPAPIRKNDS